MKFVVVLCLFALSSYAQFTDTPYPYMGPVVNTGEEIKKCHKNLSKVHVVNGAAIIAQDCNYQTVRRAINKDLLKYNKCLDKASLYASAFNDIYFQCSDTGTMNSIHREGFQLCLSSLRPYELGHKALAYCPYKKAQDMSQSTQLHSCMNKLSNMSFSNSFEACKSPKGADSVLSIEFDSCKTSMKSYFNDSESESFCSERSNLQSANLEMTKSCLSQAENMYPAVSCLDSTLARVAQKYPKCLSELDKSIDIVKLYSSMEFYEITKKLYKECGKKKIVKENKNVRFLNAQYLSFDSQINSHKIGGLSGLVFNNGQLYAVSDDKYFFGPTRILVNNLTYSNDKFSLDPQRYIYLEDIYGKKRKRKYTVTTKEGKRTKKEEYKEIVAIDPEGITINNSGDFVISSETLDKDSKTLLRTFNMNGDFLGELKTPSFYQPKFVEEMKEVEIPLFPSYYGDDPYFPGEVADEGFEPVKYRKEMRKVQVQKNGIAPNKGFEALSSSLDGQYLFTASESPLVQDKKSGFLKISKIKQSSKGEIVQVYNYKLEKEKDNGLVDLIEVRNGILFTLERSWNSRKRKLTARIFEINLNTYDDSKKAAIDKKIILELDDLLPQLPAGLRTIDNLEALTLGPVLPNGSQSLILVSDNNFSFKQRNQFIFLEILK